MGKDGEKSYVEEVGEYPKKDVKAYGYDAVEGAVGSIPFAGAALQKLVQSLGYDPFSRRQQEFVERLGRNRYRPSGAAGDRRGGFAAECLLRRAHQRPVR